MLKLNYLILVVLAAFVPALSFAADVQTGELKTADELMLQFEEEGELSEESMLIRPRHRPHPPRRVNVASECFARDRYGRLFSAVHRYAHHAQHLAVRRCERVTYSSCYAEGCRAVRRGHYRGGN